MGNAADDAVLLKVCLDRDVALSDRCAFRYRVYDWSYGLSVPIQDLAEAIRRAIHMLDSDPDYRSFARTNPAEWRDVLAHDVARMGLGELVHFVGPQADPARYFSLFDVLMLTSREDPFPLVCLEAAALGVPTICFADAGVCPNLSCRLRRSLPRRRTRFRQCSLAHEVRGAAVATWTVRGGAREEA